MEQQPLTVIIGGGISGLSCAWGLHAAGKPFLLLEASKQTGGCIHTTLLDGYTLEDGPNSILLSTSTLTKLSQVPGITDALLPANAVADSRYIYRNGAPRALPTKPQTLLLNGFFSIGAKWKVLKEIFIKPYKPAEEITLDSFFRQHFGAEITDYAVAPFVGGIYAGDIQKLLLYSSFPTLAKAVATKGSVIKSFAKAAPTARRKSYSFKQGMQQLPSLMAKALESSIKYNATVSAITVKNDLSIGISRYQVHVKYADSSTQIIEAKHIVLAVPAPTLAQLLAPFHSQFAHLDGLVYAPMAVVHTAVAVKDLTFNINGFGVLHPPIEALFTNGTIWNTSVFSNRAPNGEVLLTSFVGGTKGIANYALSDNEIKDNTWAEINHIYCSNQAVAPLMQHIFRWPKAIPQYDAIHKKINEGLPTVLPDGLHICSNVMGGVSLSDCMEKGFNLADAIG